MKRSVDAVLLTVIALTASVARPQALADPEALVQSRPLPRVDVQIDPAFFCLSALRSPGAKLPPEWFSSNPHLLSLARVERYGAWVSSPGTVFNILAPHRIYQIAAPGATGRIQFDYVRNSPRLQAFGFPVSALQITGGPARAPYAYLYSCSTLASGVIWCSGDSGGFSYTPSKPPLVVVNITSGVFSFGAVAGRSTACE